MNGQCVPVLHFVFNQRQPYALAFLAMAIDVLWLTSRPGRFTPGKEPQYPLNKRMRGPQRRSGRFGVDKNLLALPEFESRTVQLIASHYFDSRVGGVRRKNFNL
jgi:hypothetical protein